MKGFPILQQVAYYKAPPVYEVKPAKIPEFVEYIEIITNGTVFFRPSNAKGYIPFGYGTMFWHHPGEETIHKTVPESPYECICLRFDTSNFNNRGERFPRLSIWENKDEVILFANWILSALHNPVLDKELLSIYCYSKISLEASIFLSKKHSPVLPAPLEKFIKFIEENFSGNIVSEDFANSAGISIPHLHLLSKKFLNRTPHEILLEKRLSEARKKLITSHEPIKEISSSCGFLNIESFYRAFKKRYKTTPAKFRKENERNRIF